MINNRHINNLKNDIVYKSTKEFNSENLEYFIINCEKFDELEVEIIIQNFVNSFENSLLNKVSNFRKSFK